MRLGRAFPFYANRAEALVELVADARACTRRPIRKATFRRASRPQPDRGVPSTRGRSPFAGAGNGGDVAQRRSGPVSPAAPVPRPARSGSASSRCLRHGVRHRRHLSAPSQSAVRHDPERDRCVVLHARGRAVAGARRPAKHALRGALRPSQRGRSRHRRVYDSEAADADLRLVVGDGPASHLRGAVGAGSSPSDVVFAGRVNRLRPRYLASADVLCSPCSLASFGMVVLEGISAGVPVVATRLPGFARVMRDGTDGLMVDDPEDDAGFASALGRVLADPALGARMGRRDAAARSNTSPGRWSSTDSRISMTAWAASARPLTPTGWQPDHG